MNRNKFLALCLFFALFSFLLVIPVYAEDSPYIDKDPELSSVETSDIKVDTNTGAFTYNIPIEIPSGRSGLNPNLALTYNNQEIDNLNLAGFGWLVNIPSIQRVPKEGVNSIYNNNYFVSSLGGELVPINLSDGIHGIYATKVDNGDFMKYEFTTGDYWLVTDKTGVVYRFGYSTTSRQDNPSDSSQIYKWMLDETRDTNDNYVKYEYYKDSGQIYPDKVIYTGHGTTDGMFEVEFLRESRSDILKSRNTNFEIVNNYRIYEIKVSINNNWVKKYELDYITAANGSRSILNTVTESANKDGVISTMPVINFDYQVVGNGWDLYATSTISEFFTNEYGSEYGTRLADVNGDGLVDILRGFQFVGGTDVNKIYLNNGDGWDLYSTSSIPEFFVNNYNEDKGTRLADVNGDGLVDILRGYTYVSGVVESNKDKNSFEYEAKDINFDIFKDPDLAAGINKADISVEGIKSSNSWNLDINLSDTFDYSLKSYGNWYEWPYTFMNNRGYYAMQRGALNPYNLEFNYNF